MTFEDAIKSLGAEFGVDLEPEDGAVSFAIAGDDGDSVDIVVREAEDRESADISADLGELPAAGGDALLLEMLVANHLFGGTGGASLLVDGTRAKLERRVPLTELGRGEGSRVLAPFLATAGRWRGIIAGETGERD